MCGTQLTPESAYSYSWWPRSRKMYTVLSEATKCFEEELLHRLLVCSALTRAGRIHGFAARIITMYVRTYSPSTPLGLPVNPLVPFHYTLLVYTVIVWSSLCRHPDGILSEVRAVSIHR